MPDATTTAEKKPAPVSTKKKAAKKPTRAKPKPAPFDVLALRKKLGSPEAPAPRPVLAKLLGMHVNSVANLEHGSVPSEKTRKKLEEIAAKAATGKLSIPKPKKAAAPAKARKPGRPGKKVAVTPRKSSEKDMTPAIDVAALRAKLGMSRNAFAKTLDASPGSVFNWERGLAAPSKHYLPKLREIAAEGKAGKVAVASKARGRARSVPIVGSVPVLYANVVSVVREHESARIRFGLVVPGERGARCVADVVVEGEALGRIER